MEVDIDYRISVNTLLHFVCFFLLLRYEDEINKRTSAENEFVVLKKVSMYIEVKCLKGHTILCTPLWDRE